MIDGYQHIFKQKPSIKYKAPFKKGDHLDLDTSYIIDEEGIHKYQSLSGPIKWAVFIGRIYIAEAVISLFGYHYVPK